MNDSYLNFVNSPLGARVARSLGLPKPEVLRRYRADAPEFERYDERFDARTGAGGFEIWLPVE